MDNLTKFNILLLTLTLAVFSLVIYVRVKVHPVKDDDEKSKEKMKPLVYSSALLLIIVGLIGLIHEGLVIRARMR